MYIIPVAYHSGYGHTAQVAQAVAKGLAQIENIDVHVINVAEITDTDWEILDSAHTIVFGAPTYMGGVSGPFKSFLDATSGRWLKLAWKDKLAAGFTNSGTLSGDKLHSLHQMVTTAMQHGMIWVGQVEPSPAMTGREVPDADQVNRIGSWSGVMTQSNHESPDIVPPPGDLETARRFGKRIAEITVRFCSPKCPPVDTLLNRPVG
jgi:multimeric flavodoxin WrbA